MIADVVVVGAGPAGAIAARELARRGAKVLLADKATFPRWKVCGCCLNGNALAALASVGLGELPAKLGAVPLAQVRLGVGRRSARIAIPGGVSLSREAFDAALIDEAIAAGATFRPETTVRVGEAGMSDIALTLNGTPATARVVVAADGLTSPLTASTPSRHARIGAGCVLRHPSGDYEAGTIFMAAGRGGYVGLVRLEDHRLDVAAAFDVEFVREAGSLAEAGRIVVQSTGWPVPNFAAAHWKGTPVLTRRPANVAGPRWFAIGDAAGYVEPFTGEGMAWAMASAAAVVPFAEQAWSPELAGQWARHHRKIVGGRQRTCRIVAAGLRSHLARSLAVRALALVPSFAGPLLRGLNRPPRLRGLPR